MGLMSSPQKYRPDPLCALATGTKSLVRTVELESESDSIFIVIV